GAPMLGSRRFQPVYVASGTCNSGKRIPPKSLPSASVRGTSTANAFPTLGGSFEIVPDFHCGPKWRWYRRVIAWGVSTLGIFGNVHLLRGTGVPSAIFG